MKIPAKLFSLKNLMVVFLHGIESALKGRNEACICLCGE
jgi:hypothetical protein